MYKQNSKPRNKSNGRGKGRQERNCDSSDKRSVNKSDGKSGVTELLDAKGRDNNPNWYFTDAKMADQVSQMAFQNLAGYPVTANGKSWDVPNLVRIGFNPSPGVIESADYGNTMLNRSSGINLAGFRIFSMLSAYTGRVAIYGPQDISTMILAMGEVISAVEWIRRVFGVANAYSLRNRSYPRDVLNWAFLVDEDDFFKNFANYRTRFNGLITMVNQLPIPKGIAYFDKCAAMYEKMYLDSPSSMAQSLVTTMWTTWYLDETSDPRGSILSTKPWCCDENNMYAPSASPKLMSNYLDKLDAMIALLLNSSSLQVVYTDLLNLSVKVGQEFWKLDYLPDGYLVTPEYNAGFLLQMHNATVAGMPIEATELTTPHVTALNDVVPNASTNALFYNPGFPTNGAVANGMPRTGNDVIVDMLTDSPTVEDRVEVTRYTSLAYGNYYGSNDRFCDTVLPDHYVVSVGFRAQNPSMQVQWDHFPATIVTSTLWGALVSAISQIDWAPRFYEVNNTATPPALTGNFAGDLNYYTVVDRQFLKRLHQFMSLGLYSLRK